MRVSPERSADRSHSECPQNPFVAPAHEGAAAPAESLAAEAEFQARYREEYLLQLRRRSCPGCGEDFSVY